MGQKVHPTGFRLGVIKKHNALWYAKGKSSCFVFNEFSKSFIISPNFQNLVLS